MKRRRLLQTVATLGAAGGAGCVSVRLADSSDNDDNDGETDPEETQLPVPDNFGLRLCSADDTAIYQISDPRFSVGEEETAFRGTIEYIGEDTNQFAVTTDLRVTYYDEAGDRIGQELQTLRFDPDSPKEYLVTVSPRGNDQWDQVAAFTVGVRDPTGGGDGEDGCLVDEFADPESGGSA
jgi:hypothetical protein